MKHIILIKCLYVTLFLCIVISCAPQKNHTTNIAENNNLSPVLSIGHEGELIFSHPYRIAQDRMGSFFISDINVPAVYQVDSKGKYIQTYGREGRGPREYEHPQLIDIYDEWIYVSDGFRMVKFNTTMDTSNTVFFERYFTEFDVAGETIYGFAPGPFGSATASEEKLIGVFSNDGEKKHAFGDYLTADEPLPAGVSWPFIQVENDIVHLVFVYFPIYRAYTTGGELIIEQDLSELVPDSAKVILDYINPISNRENFTPSSTGRVKLTSVNRTFYVHENRVFVSRQGRKIVIDEYLFNNDSLSYHKTHIYENVPEDYYVIDFVYHEASNSFYILEQNDVPMITKYEIDK